MAIPTITKKAGQGQGRQLRLLTATSLAWLATVACTRDDKFPAIGEAFAWPTDVSVSTEGQHFYVLNSDADRTYNQGSIITLDSDGNKLSTVTTPRLGRSLESAGDYLIATFGGDDEQPNHLQVYDLSARDTPVLSWEGDLPPECVPVNTVARPGYPYFAMTCTDIDPQIPLTQLWVGDLERRWFQKVRDMDRVGRAMHIDPERGLLLVFPGDPKTEVATDFLTDDSLSYNAATDTLDEGSPNEVPDLMESSPRERERVARRRAFQMLVYDFEKNAAEGFPFVPKSDDAADLEYRWLYYSAANLDGLPDPGDLSFADPLKKFYRTNFWAAYPDPDDSSSFYLSHRNRPTLGALYANDVIKATITGDIKQATAKQSNELAPTGSYMSFERVYGFNKEVKEWHYPGDIEVRRIAGQKLILVNHFRDLDRWPRDNVQFGVVAKTMGEATWFREVTDTSAFNSYYQLAANDDGVIMSCSYYGNSVIRLAVTPGADTIGLSRIE